MGKLGVSYFTPNKWTFFHPQNLYNCFSGVHPGFCGSFLLKRFFLRDPRFKLRIQYKGEASDPG